MLTAHVSIGLFVDRRDPAVSRSVVDPFGSGRTMIDVRVEHLLAKSVERIGVTEDPHCSRFEFSDVHAVLSGERFIDVAAGANIRI